MKNLAWRCLKKIAITISVLIIFIVVMFTAARLLSPLAGRNKLFVEHATAKILKHPVHIQKVMLKWSGLEPFIIVENVSIESNNSKLGGLNVHSLVMGVDLWHSLLHLQILPAHLVLDGVRVKLEEQADKSWNMLGVGNVGDHNPLNLGKIKNFFYWLATQSSVSISRVRAELIFHHGQKIDLKKIKIQIKNKKGQREILGMGKIIINFKAQPFHFAIKSINMNDGPDLYGAQFSFNIPHIVLQSWVSQGLVSFLPSPVAVSLKDLGVRIFGSVVSGHLAELRGDFDGADMELKNYHSGYETKLKKIKAHFLLMKEKDRWSLTFDKLNLISNKQPLAIHQLKLQYQCAANQPYYHFSLDKILFSTITDVAKLSGSWDHNISVWDNQLMPQGLLAKIDFSYQTEKSSNDHFVLSGDFSKFSIKAFQKYPGINNFKGSFLLNEKQGKVSLDSRDVKVDYPYFFSKALNLSKLKTTVVWSWSLANGWLWQVPEIKICNDNLAFQGKLSLLQMPSASPQIDLQGKFGVKNMGDLSNYVPLRGISNKLQDWLKAAFHGGSITEGKIRINGADHKSEFYTRMQIADLDLHYSPKWPNVEKFNGVLEFHNKTMTVTSHDAYSVGNHIDYIQGKIPDLVHPVFSFILDTKVPMQTGLNFLAKSPLDLGEIAREWQGEGDIKVQVTFKKDLKNQHIEADAAGTVGFTNNVIQMRPKLLSFTKLNGQIQFHNKRLSSSRLTADFFSEPLSTSITTKLNASGLPIVSFVFLGNISVLQLDRALGLPILPCAQGVINYKGRLKVSNGVNGLAGNLFLTSDMLGLNLKLPLPYLKAASASHRFLLKMAFDNRKKFTLNLQYKGLLSYYAAYQYEDSNIELLSGELKLGVGDASLPARPGLLINGYLPQFNWAEWSQFVNPYLQHFQQKTTREVGLIKLRKLEVEVRHVDLFDQAYGNTYLSVLPHAHGWLINIENKKLYGTIIIPDYLHKLWKINLKKFTLTADKKHSIDLKTWRNNLDPKLIPAVNFICQSCQFNQKYLGGVKLILRKIKSGVAIKKFKIDGSDYTIQAKGSWTCLGVDKKCLTDLYGYFSSYDLGRFLKMWGITQAVVGGYGETIFSLDWRGAPYHIDLAHLSGHISFDYSNGRIVKLSRKAESEIGLGRLLNLFSLQSLPNNLVTGFMRLGTKGFEFNHLKGKLRIKNGVGYTKKFDFSGPIAWISINGSLDFVKKKCDLAMDVVPNVTSSIPLIVGLAGGPVAGALTWIVDKFLAFKIGRVAEHSYHMQGSMSHPNITAIIRHRYTHYYHHKKNGKANG